MRDDDRRPIMDVTQSVLDRCGQDCAGQQPALRIVLRQLRIGPKLVRAGESVTRTKSRSFGWQRYAAAAPTLDVDTVEDHAVMLEGLAVWLEGNTSGIRVVGRYGSWAELIPHLGRLSDVVILDVLLGDNIPLSAKIRAILSAGPQVMVCSSVTDPAVIRQAYAAGALAYVPKTSPRRWLKPRSGQWPKDRNTFPSK